MSSFPKQPPLSRQTARSGPLRGRKAAIAGAAREKVGTERGYPGIHSPSQKNRRLRVAWAVWPFSRGGDDLGRSHEETIGLGRTGVNLL